MGGGVKSAIPGQRMSKYPPADFSKPGSLKNQRAEQREDRLAPNDLRTGKLPVLRHIVVARLFANFCIRIELQGLCCRRSTAGCIRHRLPNHKRPSSAISFASSFANTTTITVATETSYIPVHQRFSLLTAALYTRLTTTESQWQYTRQIFGHRTKISMNKSRRMSSETIGNREAAFHDYKQSRSLLVDL
jgi:hypothetical protein